MNRDVRDCVMAVVAGMRGEKRAAANTGFTERLKAVNPNSAAILSRDVYYNGAKPRVIRDSDGMIQVIGPKGNVASDVMIVSEEEALDAVRNPRNRNHRRSLLKRLFSRA